MAYLLGWKDILRPIRDGYRHLFPSPDTGPTPEEREKQRLLDRLKGFAYFDTFDQLEAWNESDSDPVQISNTPLLARPSSVAQNGERKASVLLCHDFSGNYHEYESATAISVDGEVYCCEYLQYVDSFVYFSHKLVCVPPPSWTNTLHRNGVKVFGTLLIEPQTKDSDRLLHFTTEGEDGRANIEFPQAKKLADIAKHYGFDGWLINIEKPFSQRSWELNILKSFLGHLREAMGDSGELIWYDALTVDNQVTYQNALNTKNLPFAISCGALLTNYCWKEEDALGSKNFALHHSLPLKKLYFGVDVWAQNTTSLTHPRVTYPGKGGGGTNTGVAVSKLAELGLSVCIFAPAWSFEHFPGFSREAERALWSGAELPGEAACSCGDTDQRHPANPEHPITRSATQFPAGSEQFFYTDFSRAIAQHGSKEANRISNNKLLHSQLGSQSVLPSPSMAAAVDDRGKFIDILTHRLEIDNNRTRLYVEAQGIDLSKAIEGRTYERWLPLFNLDMRADGTLQLTISCAYLGKTLNAVAGFYLKFTNGIKLIQLGENLVQNINCAIRPDDQPNQDVRLQELGVHLHSDAIAESAMPVLELYEIRIVPCTSLYPQQRLTIYDVGMEKRGEGDAEHRRLKWAYCDESLGAEPGIPHSNITGPFSYFLVQVDEVELGRAYALEYVLPPSLVEGLGRKGTRIVLVGIGFDGRELARYDCRIQA